MALTFRNSHLIGFGGTLGDVGNTNVVSLSLKESDSQASPLFWKFSELAKNIKEIDLSRIVWREFHVTSYGWAVLTYQGRNSDSQMSGFFLVDIDKGSIFRHYGAAQPFESALAWDGLSGKDWASRNLDHSALSPVGMLFYDQTPNRGSEYRAISYYSPWLPSEDPSLFTRVKGLPIEEISGISVANDGVLVSFGSEQTIAWFGNKNIFDETRYRSRRPSLREMSAEEYRNLLGETK